MPASLTATMLGLPSITAVPANKGRLPKEAFYQGLEITVRLKRQFIDDIESLTMLALIRSKETGIPDGTGYKTAVFRNANVNEGIHEGRLYVSEPHSLNKSGIRIAGTDLEQVWDSLCSQTALNDETPKNVDQRIAIRERIMKLSAEQQRLKTAHAKARQIGRRNELWNQLRKVADELDRLKRREISGALKNG